MSSNVLSYNEAASLIAAYTAQLAATPTRPDISPERVDLSRARGRVLARPVHADRDLPPFSRSTRDGFACRALESATYAPLEVAGATRAGDAPPGPLPPGTAWEIMTGAPVPAGADAVMMVEHVEIAQDRVRLLQPHRLLRGENIVPQGAEARSGDELLRVGFVMEPGQIGLAASCGYSALEVFPRPRVAILATGDELVSVESTPGPGQIRNSNSPMLAAMVTAAGGEPWILPVGADNAAALDTSLALAMEADFLLITGGVSAGKFDLVEPALARAGARFHFTGVQIQPGKPVVFGDLPGSSHREPRRPFFGLPGNPVSSAVTFLLFAAPVLAALSGRLHLGPRFALARLAAENRQKLGLTRFLPAWCTFSALGDQWPEVVPVSWQGSGDLAALARSNCFVVLPSGSDQLHSGEIKAGEIVRILLSQGIA